MRPFAERRSARSLRFITLGNICQAIFISNGDIRLLPADFARASPQFLGYLLTAGNLAFQAADIYPATDTAFVIEAVPRLSTSAPTTSPSLIRPA